MNVCVCAVYGKIIFTKRIKQNYFHCLFNSQVMQSEDMNYDDRHKMGNDGKNTFLGLKNL